MRKLKMLGVGLAGLLFLVSLISLLFPARVKVERGVVIEAPIEKVFSTVSDLQTWKQWNPLLVTDMDSSFVYSDPSFGEGAKMSWQRQGSLNEVKIEEVNALAVATEMKLFGQRPVKGIFRMIQPPDDSRYVQVSWTLVEELRWYPWERFYSIFIDQIRGPFLEQGMNDLKKYIEDPRLFYGYDMEIIPVRDTVVAVLEGKAVEAEVDSLIYRLEKDLRLSIAENNLKITNSMMVHVSDDMNEQGVPTGLRKVMVGLPVNHSASPKAAFQSRLFPPGRLLVLHYTGGPAGMEAAYRAMEAYCKEKGYSIPGLPYEMHVTDRRMEPDTGRWKTDIYFPIMKG